jgi:hypothetical protein
MVVAVIGYALCGILFGRRMEAGTWLLVALWHSSTIRGKPIRLGRLLFGFAVVGCAFQWIEMLRTESDAVHSIFADLFLSQGVIFMIPALAWQLPTPPLHTIFGSFLSIRHFYRILGVGSIGTDNVLDYISSQSSPTLFVAGNGLSSTGYLDIFYACGQAMALYAVVCGLLGYLLRNWEAWSSRSSVALFFLCVCLPSLFFVQRSSVFSVTSPIAYLSLFMAATYVLHLFLTLIEFNATRAESIHGKNSKAFIDIHSRSYANMAVGLFFRCLNKIHTPSLREEDQVAANCAVDSFNPASLWTRKRVDEHHSAL